MEDNKSLEEENQKLRKELEDKEKDIIAKGLTIQNLERFIQI